MSGLGIYNCVDLIHDNFPCKQVKEITPAHPAISTDIRKTVNENPKILQNNAPP